MDFLFLRLFFEFARVGLFAVGGGLATIPFLSDLGARSGWFSPMGLADMIAVSESTPGPLGVNMASYVGFDVGGILGGILATLGLIAPSILIILIVARFLRRFRNSPLVEGVFYGLRPASTALIAAAGLSVAQYALFDPAGGKDAALWGSPRLPCILLAAAVFFCLQWKPLRKIHPIFYILLSAAVGVALKL
ncbi:MAG: chromate transporter [Oscillospiraceae bacterium]